MTIAAEIICDSISPEGKRITTLRVRYPRFIHAEFMTHRVFSRNASSSRAIPVEKLIADVERDPAMPIHWGKNQPGMQAREDCNELILIPDVVDIEDGRGLVWGTSAHTREGAWEMARNQAIIAARAFTEAGYHKQIVNRLLEPFSHINVLVTSTEWDNFFELRDHPDAQPEIMVLAQEMKKTMAESTPRVLRPGDWHLPYISIKEWIAHDDQTCIKMSVSRCARVSYLTHEGKAPDIEADLKLYDRLVGSRPLHASPAEHQATPVGQFDRFVGNKEGNFQGWYQYRKLLEHGEV